MADIKVHQKILTTEGKKLLTRISQYPILEQFHLVGGTALALYLGHRVSIDFDFFSPADFRLDIHGDLKINPNDKLQIITNFTNSVEVILNGVKVFFWRFSYPLIKPTNTYNNIKLASLVDLALLKLLALEGRITWKDLIDLYFIDKEFISLPNLIATFKSVYPTNLTNPYSQFKVLLNEAELEKSPKPLMLKEVDFEVAKTTVFKKLLSSFKESIFLVDN